MRRRRKRLWLVLLLGLLPGPSASLCVVPNVEGAASAAASATPAASCSGGDSADVGDQCSWTPRAGWHCNNCPVAGCVTVCRPSGAFTFTPSCAPVACAASRHGVRGALDEQCPAGAFGSTCRVRARVGYDCSGVRVICSGLEEGSWQPTGDCERCCNVTVTPVVVRVLESESPMGAAVVVRLGSRPSSDVTVPFAVDDSAAAVLSADGSALLPSAAVTFSPSNWATPRFVTVAAVDDALADGNKRFTLAAGPISSADPGYAGVQLPAITGTAVDDDSPGVVLGPPSGAATSEDGGAVWFTVSLRSQPTAEVTLSATVLSAEATLVPSSLTFLPTDWSTARTVTVTGVDDAVVDGDQAYTVAVQPLHGADALYNAVAASLLNLTNTDDDSAGVTVAPASLSVREGAAGFVAVALRSQPTADVLVPVSNAAGANDIVFTAATWAVPQTVSVGCADDEAVSGDRNFTVVFGPTESNDTMYSGVHPTALVTCVDVSVAGVTVDPIAGLITTEAGGSAVFSVVLASLPAADVVIGVLSSNPGEGTVHPTALHFTPASWRVPQNVTVTGVDDSVADGTVTYTVMLDPAVSGDRHYDGLDAPDVEVMNTDDDAAAVVVTPTAGLRTTEWGGTATFAVVLSSQPTHSVTISVSSNDPSEGVVSPAVLVFTSLSWAVPSTVTVTGVDDDADDGDRLYIVELVAATDDVRYRAAGVPNVVVTNVDDDSVTLHASPALGFTTEAGGVFTTVVSIGSKPKSTVSLAFRSENPSEARVGSPATLSFSPGEWKEPRTLTVVGVDDNVADGDQAVRIAADISTADADYSQLTAPNVTVVNRDDDVASVIVSGAAGGLVTSETGTAVSFTVQLGSEPRGLVYIGVEPDPTEGSVQPADLVFDAASWSTKQTVTLRGVDDSRADGDVLYALSVSPRAATADAVYASLPATVVSVVNRDDDEAGVLVTPASGGVLTEGGDAVAAMTVVLASEPLAAVFAEVAANSSECTVTPASLSFSPGSWGAPQTVVVTAPDNLIDDGNRTCTVSVFRFRSDDPMYDSEQPHSVAVIIADDDSAGVDVTAGASRTVEGGTGVPFQVVLALPPRSDVRIPVAVSDAREATAEPRELLFDPSNWDVPQTVIVAGQRDFVVDGDVNYTVLLLPARSLDASYDRFDPADVPMVSVDVDEARVLVSDVGPLVTTESGGSATVRVTLTSIPLQPVEITAMPQRDDEGAATPPVLVLTAANWSRGGNITVRGLDDPDRDGDQTYLLVLSAASLDPLYNRTAAPAVTVTNVDDDEVGVWLSAGDVRLVEGGAARVGVRLQCRPTAAVHLRLQPTNVAEASVSPTTLSFAAADWSTPQTVTVSTADNTIDDGDRSHSIAVSVVGSQDAAYSRLAPSALKVLLLDDEVAGLHLLALPADTSEKGASSFLAVVLSAEPLATVTLSVTSTRADEGVAAPATLVFTSGDWYVPQTVTVTGVDDDVDDGTQPYAVRIGPAVSGDPAFAGLVAEATLRNTDDDEAGMVVSRLGGLRTDERGGRTHFAVSLTSQPVSLVTIPVASSDAGEGITDRASLTFSADDWERPQTVHVLGVDDSIDDGDVKYSVVLGAAASSDPRYRGMDPPDVTVMNTDDDTAGVRVSQTHLVVAESGGTATFTLSLTSEPVHPVLCLIRSDVSGEVSVRPSEVVLGAANWSAGVDVRVAGVDDAVDDGDVTVVLRLEPLLSRDAEYDGRDPPDVAVVSRDNDEAGVALEHTALVTTESGGRATFTLALTSQPLHNVTMRVRSSDASEGEPIQDSVTFTPSGWEARRTVTVAGVDDPDEDGDISYRVQVLPAESLDPLYSGRGGDAVTVVNVDDDVAGVVANASALALDEGSGAALTVHLSARPAAAVSVDVTSTLRSILVNPAELEFTQATWNVPQVVSVRSTDNTEADGGTLSHVVLSPLRSTDPQYAALPSVKVLCTTVDDDAPGVRVSGEPLVTFEGGGSSVLSVALDSRPQADVFVDVAVTEPGEASLSAAWVAFTPSNWTAPARVLVTGLDDDVADGDVDFFVTLGPARSQDPSYNGLRIPSVAAVNKDDDTAAVVVTAGPSGLVVGEAGTSATFSVSLSSRPLHAVTVAVRSTDETEVVVSTSFLAFLPASWSVRQTVTATGVDDATADGDQTRAVEVGPTGSADGDYNKSAVERVAVVNADDDAAGVFYSPVGGLATDEGGTAAHVVVGLRSMPVAEVVIPISSSHPNEGIVRPAALTFTPANWAHTQTVTVVGVDDDVQDGNVHYAVLLRRCESADSVYAGMEVGQVDAVNRDDDVAGLSVEPTRLLTREGGEQQMVKVQLTSRPAADVTVAVRSGDATEGVCAPEQLVFSASSWQVPRSVTVTPADDDEDDGDVGYIVRLLPVRSADPLYDAADPDDVSVLNADDDVAEIVLSPLAVRVSESGTSSEIAASLRSRPLSATVLSVAVNDSSEATVSPAFVVFDAENWTAGAVLTVTGVDDGVADGDVLSAVRVVAVDGDAGYLRMEATAAVTTVDDDRVGISAGVLSGHATSELGTAVLVAVSLGAQPQAQVTVPVSSSDRSEAEVSADTLVFTQVDWATVQTVTVRGVDDPAHDGTALYSVLLGPAVSADGRYDGVSAPPIELSNVDDDSSGVELSLVSEAVTSEDGRSAVLQLRLLSRPSHAVSVPIETSDESEGASARRSLDFTPSSWDTPQQFSVVGADDFVADGNVSYSVAAGPAVSLDGRYGGVRSPPITLVNVDDDVPGVVVTLPGERLQVEENGDAAFTVRLRSEPLGTVVVSLQSNDTGEIALTPAQLVFSPALWMSPQTVSASGVPDGAVDGAGPARVVVAQTSSDGAYDALPPLSFTALCLDRDVAAVTASAGMVLAAEGGAAANFSVALSSRPRSSVRCTVSSANPAAGVSASPSQLTFGQQDWDVAQTVFVAVRDDHTSRSDLSTSVTVGECRSGDPNFDGAAHASVQVVIRDDDAAGLETKHLDALAGRASVLVWLRSQPAAEVQVRVQVAGSSQSVHPTILAFAVGNWSVPQSLLLTGGRGGEVYELLLGPAVSSDVHYAGLQVRTSAPASPGGPPTAAPAVPTTHPTSASTAPPTASPSAPGTAPPSAVLAAAGASGGGVGEEWRGLAVVGACVILLLIVGFAVWLRCRAPRTDRLGGQAGDKSAVDLDTTAATAKEPDGSAEPAGPVVEAEPVRVLSPVLPIREAPAGAMSPVLPMRDAGGDIVMVTVGSPVGLSAGAMDAVTVVASAVEWSHSDLVQGPEYSLGPDDGRWQTAPVPIRDAAAQQPAAHPVPVPAAGRGRGRSSRHATPIVSPRAATPVASPQADVQFESTAFAAAAPVIPSEPVDWDCGVSLSASVAEPESVY